MELNLNIFGKEFIFSRMNAEDISKIQSKKAKVVYSSGKDPGDEDILRSLISDNREELNKIIDEFPAVIDQIWKAHLSLCGDDYNLSEKELSFEEKTKYGIPVVCLIFEGPDENSTQEVIFKKISRANFAILQKEIVKNKVLTSNFLLPLAKELCIDKNKGDELEKLFPVFYINAGWTLFNMTSAKIEEGKKKL